MPFAHFKLHLGGDKRYFHYFLRLPEDHDAEVGFFKKIQQCLREMEASVNDIIDRHAVKFFEDLALTAMAARRRAPKILSLLLVGRSSSTKAKEKADDLRGAAGKKD